MAPPELEVQPIPAHNASPPLLPSCCHMGLTGSFVQMAEMELPSDHICPEEDHVPMEKSGVYVDPMAANQSGRFQKHDEVHMSIIEGGIRTKGTFTIAKGRLHSSRGYYEYQLYTAGGGLYNGGQWVREKDLKRQKR